MPFLHQNICFVNKFKSLFSIFTDDDDYIHLHKGELTRSALLFGAGILKGAIITGLINNANNGITIGK